MSVCASGRTSFRPALEQLEARECPSFNIHYTTTLLLIQGRPTLPFVNPGDGLQLHLLASGGLQVLEVEGATTFNYGTYRPPRDVQVFLDFNTDHDLTVDLGGGRLPSNLQLNLGKGNLDVLAFHPINIINGVLGGNLTIRGGSGGEFIDLGSLDGTQPVGIQGDVTLVLSSNHTPIGGDFLNVNAGSTLFGRLTGSEVDNITVGGFNGPAEVLGDVLLSVAQSRNVGRLDVFGRVDSSATFVGSPVTDPNFADSVIVEPGAVVAGNVTAALGNGRGVVEVRNTATVQGNVSVFGAVGDNFVNLIGSVLGSVQLQLRNGNNHVTFTGAIGGNLAINAGDGNNDLTAFAGTVAGSVAINLGNGNDSLVFNGTIAGPSLTYRVGNGSNSLVINGDNTFALFVHTGNGSDTVQISNNNGVGSATIDFGNGSNLFLPPPIIFFPLVLRNFP